jgi:hypothetical protein
MSVDPAFAFAIAIVAPGLALFLTGSGIRLWRRVASHRDSLLGIRISIVGLVMILLVPGISILVAVIGGWLMWPAALAAVVALVYSVRMVSVARQHWHQSMSGN